MPGWEGPPAWSIYIASSDVDAAAAKIRDNGGELMMEPMAVGEFGKMLMAKDPSGVVFGVWQAGTHEGFEKQGEAGAFCWAEVTTRDVEKADGFFPAVFGYGVKTMQDEAVDFKLYDLGDDTAFGRMKMTKDWRPRSLRTSTSTSPSTTATTRSPPSPNTAARCTSARTTARSAASRPSPTRRARPFP